MKRKYSSPGHYGLCNFKYFTVNSWTLCFQLFSFIVIHLSGEIRAEENKMYNMQTLCENLYLRQMYRKIDGAVIISQNERSLDCTVTFQTHSILQRFMLRFDNLQIDCNDYLDIYDGAHAGNTANRATLNCRNTTQSFGFMQTRTNFVTIKFVTDTWGTESHGFKLIITAVRDQKLAARDFNCTNKDYSISPDLLCDGVDHCGNGSDEANCNSDHNSILDGLMTSMLLFVVIGVFCFMVLIVFMTVLVCRSRQQNSQNQMNNSMQLHHTGGMNGSSKHLNNHGGTLPREQTLIPLSSGNLHHPAEPSEGLIPIGHHRAGCI